MSDSAVPLRCFYCGDEIKPGVLTQYWLPDGPIHKSCYERRLAEMEPGSIVLTPDEMRQIRDALFLIAMGEYDGMEVHHINARRARKVAFPALVILKEKCRD